MSLPHALLCVSSDQVPILVNRVPYGNDVELDHEVDSVFEGSRLNQSAQRKTRLRLTLLAGTDFPQVIPRIDPARMAIIPVNLQCIAADRLDIQHLRSRLEHLERRCLGIAEVSLLGLGAVRSRACYARTLVAQKSG